MDATFFIFIFCLYFLSDSPLVLNIAVPSSEIRKHNKLGVLDNLLPHSLREENVIYMISSVCFSYPRNTGSKLLQTSHLKKICSE